jgi:predicted dehydrogenase
MSRAYTAALVGLGNIAWKFDNGRASPSPRTHLAAYLKHGTVTVVCGYSPEPKDREQFEKNCGIRACSNLNDVWDAKPDIVSICSPSQAHYEQTAACLDHNVPMVWLEKPPTLTLADLEALIRQSAAHRGRTKVLVNYMRRYSAMYQRLGDLYRQRRLGRPLGLQVLYSRGLETNGSHFLDVVFSVRGDGLMPEVSLPDAERTAESPSFLLRFRDGPVVSFCGHATSYHINDVILTCEDGRMSVLSGGRDTRLERKVPNDDFPGFFRLGAANDDVSTHGLNDAFSEALTDLIRSFEADTQPRSNLATARQTQAVIDQIRKP